MHCCKQWGCEASCFGGGGCWLLNQFGGDCVSVQDNHEALGFVVLNLAIPDVAHP